MAAEIEAAAEYILGVPAEYVPMAMIIAMVCGLLCTLAVSLPGYYAQDKKIARENSGKLTYGISYLSSNILTVVIAVVGSLVVIGWYADASGVAMNAGLCNTIAVVVSVIVGFGGEKFLALPFVESLRDKAKAKDARTQKPQ